MADPVERFNLAAHSYATDRYPGRAQCAWTVLELLEPKLDDVVLDVGCASGAQLISLAQAVRRGYGIDPATQMIQQARARACGCSNLLFLVGSAEDIPQVVRDSGVNKIMSNYALHHLDERRKRRAIGVLSEMLPNDGTLVLGDLMFSDDPDRHVSLFDTVGYGPGCDSPARVDQVESMFVASGLSVQTRILNPLVAIIVGRKTR